jgi:hypothetical protein
MSHNKEVHDLFKEVRMGQTLIDTAVCEEALILKQLPTSLGSHPNISMT